MDMNLNNILASTPMSITGVRMIFQDSGHTIEHSSKDKIEKKNKRIILSRAGMI